jgi:hypothetical protein
VERWKHITPTHVVRALPLRADRRAELLLRAEENCWSVSELTLHARAHAPRKRRRAPLPLCAQAIHAMDRMTAKDGKAFAEVDQVLVMPEREHAQIHDTLIRICQRLEELGWCISSKRRQRGRGPRTADRA